MKIPYRFEYIDDAGNPNCVALVIAGDMQKAMRGFHDKVQLGLLEKVMILDDVDHVFMIRRGKLPIDILNIESLFPLPQEDEEDEDGNDADKTNTPRK